MNSGIAISTERNKNNILYLLLSFILPVCLTLLWLLKNNQFPASDATDYLDAAHNIYKFFANDGLLSGIFHTYWIRGWRPIFFPVITVPFMLLSHGNITFSYNAAVIACIITSAIYVYFYLRLFLDKFSSMLATNLICMLPFVLNPAFIFMTELALFPLVLGSLYHLIQSAWFTNKKHNIGFLICITLAVLVRPVEATTDLLLVLLTYFAMGLYRRTFSLKEITLVLTICIAATFCFLYLVVSDFMSTHWFFYRGHLQDTIMAHFAYTLFKLTTMLLIATSIFLLYLFKFHKNSIVEKQSLASACRKPIVTIFGIMSLIALIWFSHLASRTYGWIYFTSMGDIAATYNQLHPTISLPEIIYGYASEESIITILGIFLLFALGIIMTSKDRLLRLINSPKFIFPLMMLPFPIWEVFNTCQRESRKISLVISIALAILLCIGLQHGKWWRVRLGILLTILTLQSMSLFHVIYPNFPSIVSPGLSGTYATPISINPNPHNVVLDFLNTMSKKYDLHQIFIGETYKYYLPVYPYLLIMMAHTFDYPYKLFWTGYGVYPDNILTRLGQEHDGIFLVNKDEEMVPNAALAKKYLELFTTESIPDAKIYYGFLYYFTSNKLDEIGLKLGPCISFSASDGKNYRGCMLVSTRKWVGKLG